MNRLLLSTLCLVAAVLTGCAAGAPGPGNDEKAPTAGIALIAPTPVAALSAAPSTSRTTVPATATARPLPSAAPTRSTAPATLPRTPVATATTGSGPQPTARPAPPPDPGTGESQIVEGGPNDRKQVALTFDAGADTGNATAILDLLDAEGIKGSFGMTGLWAENNPEIVKRMVADGHMLFNHTWDHASLTGENTGQPAMSFDQLAKEVGDTENLVKQLTGYDMKPYFRPPFGDYDRASLGYLEQLGYSVTVWWTCDTHGWDGWDAAKITGYCTTNIKPHEILLLHVGAGALGDLEALPGMIDFFRSKGYEFVTVEQMLQP